MTTKADTYRQALREGYSLEYIAQQHGVTAATVKRHAAYAVADRTLLIGTEVHIISERGRWEFIGGIGYNKAGEQYAEFRHARTGRTRTFLTTRIDRVHQK